jgi:hypothetical protein
MAVSTKGDSPCSGVEASLAPGLKKIEPIVRRKAMVSREEVPEFNVSLMVHASGLKYGGQRFEFDT